ncbi:MAG TPA: FAD-dependent oxidoreductase [Allosphingosinicella sp.]|jgi:monoamine oxidase
MALTRRSFLERLGAVGGVSAAYLGMEAMGLLNTPPASAEPFELPPAGRGRKVAVLGAGIAGLVSAYELKRAGFDVTVLEARDRVAGRVWTIRAGDRVVQTGRPDQVCGFSEGAYLNAGAARIPSSHHTILGYAKSLGVPLEVMVNSNRASRWDMNGRVVTNGQMMNDLRGRLTELFAKAIDRGALDREMPAAERTQLRRFLRFYGDLAENGDYTPRGRSGYDELPGGYGVTGRTKPPLRLDEIFSTRAVGLPLVFEEFFDQQAPMFQPVGGMDRIAHALFERVRGEVRLNRPVTEIRRRGEGVRIVHGPANDRRALDADHCVCTLPLPLLARVENDFSPAKRAAIAGVNYGPSVKVAFEGPRFWEDEGIYGGVGWTDQVTENLIYPSGGWHRDKGVLVAAYVAAWLDENNPALFTAMSHEERFRTALGVVERLHPGKSRLLGRPLTVAWGLTPWSEGVGPIHEDWFASPRPQRYTELMRPEGPIVFAGEHLSHVVFWQEGAALSAHEAMKLLVAQARDNAPARAA